MAHKIDGKTSRFTIAASLAGLSVDSLGQEQEQGQEVEQEHGRGLKGLEEGGQGCSLSPCTSSVMHSLSFNVTCSCTVSAFANVTRNATHEHTYGIFVTYKH